MKKLVVLLLAAALMMLTAQAFADTYKEVSIWVGRDVAPGPKIRLTINTRNVPSVTVSAHKLNNIALLINHSSPTQCPSGAQKSAATWTVNMASPKDSQYPAQRDIYRSKQVNLPPLKPGLYLLTAKGGGRDSWAVVNITNLAVVVKRSTKHILTWVCDAERGTPITGARIDLYKRVTLTRKDKAGKEITSNKYELLSSSKTQQNGTSEILAGPSDEHTIVVTNGTDQAAIPCGIGSDEGTLRSHFQTDRPVYRPGQRVYFKTILRRIKGIGYAPVINGVCTVEMRDPEDNVIDEKKITTTAVGTIAGEFDIPTEGAVGPYSIVLKLGKDSVYDTFTVAEYRKPEFKVDTKPATKRYLSGQEIVFELQSNYYFGTPLPQAEVSYKVRRSEMNYWGDSAWYSSDDGNLYPRDTYRSDEFIAEGTVYTDDLGKATIPIKTKKDLPDSVYSVDCTVRDASRREVAASASVPVYAAGIRIGIRTSVISAPLGSNIPVQIRVSDLDNKPAAAKVKLTVEGNVWVNKKKGYQRKIFTQTTVDVPANGKATAEVPAKTEGDLYITAVTTDSSGHVTRTSLTTWVADPAKKVLKEQASKEPLVSIRTDKKTYAPGETVKAWITTNTLDRPILVTAEGADVWQYAVLPAGQKTYAWKFKTTVEMSPNAFIEAAQWTRNGLTSANEMVPIPDPTRKIAVIMEPDKKIYRPGETANYKITTMNSDNKPVPAEIAVSVVDESIFAVRPDTTEDLYTTFWATRPNRVRTQYTAPEEVSGGAYQRVNSTAPVRQRFVDTAYWSAHVMTGPDGTAKVSFETPGNLTTWRATARAITADTKVGTATATTQASRPVMLRLATPRQMVQGDKLMLIATVNNRTDKAHEFETAISAEGLRIEGPITKTIIVPANGESTAEWTISADTLPESGFASITSRTLATDAAPDQGDELSDAIKVSLKIAPKGAPDRVASGGSMEQEKTLVISLPEDRIPGVGSAAVTIRDGIGQVAKDLATDVIGNAWYGSLNMADELLAITIAGPNDYPREKREALAALFKRGYDGGSESWDSGSASPETTAAILTALARARSNGLSIPDALIDRGVDSATNLYDSNNLWERAAILASAIAIAGKDAGPELVTNIREKGSHLSPFAQLSLAEAYTKLNKPMWAKETASKVLKDAVIGSDMAYMPAGDHLGWSATTVETTAQALLVLMQLSIDPDLQSKLALWLSTADSNEWLSVNDKAMTAYALNAYAKKHPQSAKLGQLTVTVNGTTLAPSAQKGSTCKIVVPATLLKNGDNLLVLKRDGPGEVFYSVDAKIFRPVQTESLSGMRVLRRYEVQSAAGLWDEMSGAIKPSQAIRCTVIICPNDRPDEMRLVEPLPAGFEFVDAEDSGCYRREEVRDGAIIHYLKATGNPVFFRYYIRPESEGTVTALPATGDAVRRPSVRGNSQTQTVEIRK